MTLNKIAVVGASARAAAFSLLRAGHEVVAADLFADADLAQRCEASKVAPYPAGFADWLAKTDCDAWLYTGALENEPELIDQLATLKPLLGHSGVAVRRVRDPLQLQTALHKADLHFPKTISASEGCPDQVHWLGKTYQGSSGSGVGVAEQAAYFQQRISGIPLSAVFRRDQLLGVTRQLVGEAWCGASDYKYCGSIAPWPLSFGCLEQLHQLGELLSREFDLQHLYGVDLIHDGQQLWTIEINPRYTAAVEVVERTHGINVFSTNTIDKTEPQAICTGKVILFAKSPILITVEYNELLMQQAGDAPWPLIADVPIAGTQIEIGQPIMSLLATADTIEEVEEQLRYRVTEAERQLYGGTLICD